MADKVQKMLNEITTRKLCTMDEHMAFYNDKAKEDYRFLSEIEEFIKALQEEHVSKQNLSNSFNIGKDCKEEPVSEDLDKAAKNYAFTMSKAEKFIQEHTRNCSNLAHLEDLNGNVWEENTPWLTPDQARKAMEIAREEMIEKFYDWLRNNATYIHPRKGTEECITTLVKLKEAMKDE